MQHIGHCKKNTKIIVENILQKNHSFLMLMMLDKTAETFTALGSIKEIRDKMEKISFQRVPPLN
jgi:hypothetical protein